MTTPAPDPQPQNTNKSGAEVLVWLGTAYGRTRVPGGGATYASPMAHVERPAASQDVSRRRAFPLVLSAIGVVILAISVWRSPVEPPAPAEPQTVAGDASISLSVPSAGPEDARSAAESLALAAGEVPSPPTSIDPPPAEEPAPAPAAAMSVESTPAETAETNNAAENFGSAPAVAPPSAEQPSPPPLPQIEVAQLAAAPAPLQPAEPEPIQVTEAAISQTPNTGTPAPAAITGYAAGNADIAAGQKHFANGDITAARRAFEKAMKAGHPEGALGMGTTFDPAAIQKAGLKAKADPALAQDWYRRAFELRLKTRRSKG